MTSCILRNQVPGFTVEGGQLPANHPAHPSQKAGILFKAIKTWRQNGRHPRLHKKKLTHAMNDHTISSNIRTTSGKP